MSIQIFPSQLGSYEKLYLEDSCNKTKLSLAEV